MRTGFPLSLPDGWRAMGPTDGVHMAALPGEDGETPKAVVTVGPSDEPAPDGLDAMTLILDEGEVRCRGGVPARRLLTAHPQGERCVTTELWLVAGDAPANLCAVVDTIYYARLRPELQRILRSYRP
ncbi:hypothetical protein [Actinomadura livida]|uniref:Uncharacterized protein n=1 Tax=Actinomadura livida TaxID=79909 RepID=A0A7W7I775_9ACTN|nr:MULTISPECIES: hypothetical protein [Actinomadura]MBB4771805.1 hypothetical protein [Actinomadura catellatispora]GGU02595.1 hypothetical protein GCM10010208_28270 [Actinomadura livida]